MSEPEPTKAHLERVKERKRKIPDDGLFNITLDPDHHQSTVVCSFGSFAPGKTLKRRLKASAVFELERDERFKVVRVKGKNIATALPPSLKKQEKRKSKKNPVESDTSNDNEKGDS